MKNVEIDLHFGFYLGSYAKAKVNDGRRNFFIGSKKCQHVLCEGLTEMKRVSGPERLTIILTEDTVLLMKVKVVQSCPTLCNRMGYTVHGILQARILKWVAVSPPPHNSC